ncbi:MAG: ribosomal protein S18-alanine N-acetyltransferase [Firmicutes bacterium]|nr:ribosomal protein S18-alanine N-acetyltransferase [Bacillota bacterium]
MAGTKLKYRPMTVRDIPQVQLVEGKCFKTPWSRNIFLGEVTRNDNAFYVVAVQQERVIGFAGIWVVVDEGHITNIAVDPSFQRQGIGQGLMQEIITYALSRGVSRLTLEVRLSNQAAQALYTKLGFAASGIRREYYQDDKEDALIMWRELSEEWTNFGN